MWILKWLPDFVFYAILLIGLAGIAASFVLKFIPFVAQYRVPIQWAAGIMTAFGLYMVGAIGDNNAWLARVAELERQVAVAEAKSKETNTVIQYQYRDKVRTIKETQVVVQDRIVKEAAKMDAECKISPEAVSILNQAAGGKK
jgi:hypothetical protein